MKTINTGILGGTFDPIHHGHLAVAEVAAATLGLDEVVFVPAGKPWLKTGRRISSAKDRLQMVRLAITDKPGYRLSSIEVERKGPSYSVDTVEEMKRQAAEADELYFIIGWDSLTDLSRWYHPEYLISLCRLVVVPRPGHPMPDLDAIDVTVPGLQGRLIMLDKPRIEISASVIRERVVKGLPISHLVPEAVERYIAEVDLYR
ncbi:nicotinate-nucleotide adenylyltransferase [Chloroflexota bacterium]